MAWKYVRVKAPAEYPGKTYNSGLCLKHHLVWWQNTGQLVPKGYHIHHKDNDPTNNAFENLELIANADHGKLHGEGKTRAVVRIKCPVCDVVFERERRQTHVRKKSGVTCCSRSCSATWSNRKDVAEKDIARLQVSSVLWEGRI